jgi:aminoglycoside phosphotransferase family enzyme
MHHTGLPFAMEPERVIQTHANLVLLSGDRAYKLKKPVKFPFLDYSTLALRRQMILNELQFNRRFSPADLRHRCAAPGWRA